MVTAKDIAAVLSTEFPKTTIVRVNEELSISGPRMKACHERAKELLTAMRLFNAHADLGHLGARPNKRNWWTRV